MKILFLGNARAPYIKRVTQAFSENGHDVHVVTVHGNQLPWAVCQSIGSNHELFQKKESAFRKGVGYLRLSLKLKKILATIQPDLMVARYATTYGAIASFTDFHPFLLQVVGSDILLRGAYQKKILGKLIKYSLGRADAVYGTSRLLTKTAKASTRDNCIVRTIPSGVDLCRFVPQYRIDNGDDIVVGAVKTMSEIYGIDYLIKGFIQAWKRIPRLKLLIIGGGPKLFDYQSLAETSLPQDRYQFVGPVNHNEVADYLRLMDIFVMPSLYESFGVSAIEASAMGLPVIASDSGGIPEAVIDGVTGYLVPPESSAEIAKHIICLSKDHDLRVNMGAAGRKFVETYFDWHKNYRSLESLCLDLI